MITPISIPAGQSSVDITVSIIDDNCREEDETFNADLTVLPNQAVNLGSPDRTMITIEDDDGNSHGCHIIIQSTVYSLPLQRALYNFSMLHTQWQRLVDLTTYASVSLQHVIGELKLTLLQNQKMLCVSYYSFNIIPLCSILLII